MTQTAILLNQMLYWQEKVKTAMEFSPNELTQSTQTSLQYLCPKRNAELIKE